MSFEQFCGFASRDTLVCTLTCASGVTEYYRNSGGPNTSTRRRMMAQNGWNEMHELQRLK
ncbi:hypothetical protein FF38_02673 [Lucilia cuprina]|uniref:Uncharacterized protein n=1 Tax=Lucilia cuprina TaxID=7375 RepID=A0A0L0CDW6_LUCCU|nr:hypothetical protein FF38_02673 [Lucilia cuprina]